MLHTNHRIAEGWYPDPHGRLWLRRWDGSQWTLETHGSDDFGRPEYGVGLSSETGSPESAVPVPPSPETGWAGVAFALHSALVSHEPVRVSVELPGQPELTVNTFDHSYSWSREPNALTAEPGNARIGFTRSDFAATKPGKSLDGLLWTISQLAFPSRLAPWLQPDDLYRMVRWPNLTTINPELDDMRQAAMLTNGMFTVEELAGFSDRELAPTRSLINALSLMNTLKIAAPRTAVTFTAVPAPAPAPAPPARRPGLFQRLRERLGI